ncbi:MAG: hypothetical protein ACYS8X_11605 [Planctomycetota bacterium]|jgi:hypothetical protein
MKTLRPILLVLAAALVGCGPKDASPEFDVFQSDMTVGVSRLESRFGRFDPQTPERSAECRRLVFSLLALPSDDAQSQAMSDKLAATLARHDTFQMYDRDLLWLGSDLLFKHPPKAPSFLLALGRKVDNARQDDAPPVLRQEYSALAVGTILSFVAYGERVATYEDRVDYDEWDKLHGWLKANGQKLIYDATILRYRPSDQPPTSRPTRRVPYRPTEKSP